MSNDVAFWDNYLRKTIKNIKKMITEKEVVYTDFHMHSEYSADGTQTLNEIIKRAQSLGLDIISITDHDSVGVYDRLYEFLCANKLVRPIIVPGVEFTVDNKEYGSQCHILQLMINPKERALIENVSYNENASWNRIKLQFKRISENKTLQYFFEKYNIECTEKEYRDFLNTCQKPIPEYATLMEYLLKILSEHNVTNWEVLSELEKNNLIDKCVERKTIKANRYKVLRERYENNADASYSQRFLHSMLAVKGADDDFFPEYESCGCLSVNNYGELKLEQLNKRYLTFLAHPNEDKLYMIDRICGINDNICGMEFNRQSKYSNPNIFYEVATRLNMIQIIGSDSHSVDSEWYNEMMFYKGSIEQLKQFIDKAERLLSY